MNYYPLNVNQHKMNMDDNWIIKEWRDGKEVLVEICLTQVLDPQFIKDLQDVVISDNPQTRGVIADKLASSIMRFKVTPIE